MHAGRRASVTTGLLAVVVALVIAGCVDKAPPPMWPAPPPPSVAEVIGAPAQVRAPPMPVGVVGAGSLSGPPSPLDAVPVDSVDRANILDPDGAAATAAAQAHPPRPRGPVPTHR